MGNMARFLLITMTITKFKYLYYYIKQLSNGHVHFLSWYSNFHNTHFILHATVEIQFD
jgi:hypothetical protein